MESFDEGEDEKKKQNKMIKCWNVRGITKTRAKWMNLCKEQKKKKVSFNSNNTMKVDKGKFRILTILWIESIEEYMDRTNNWRLRTKTESQEWFGGSRQSFVLHLRDRKNGPKDTGEYEGKNEELKTRLQYVTWYYSLCGTSTRIYFA